MVNPTTESQSNPNRPNQPNQPNQPTLHLPLFDSPLFQVVSTQLRTDNDRQCLKTFFVGLYQLDMEFEASTRTANVQFYHVLNDVVNSNDNHHIVPMVEEATSSFLQDTDNVAFELHQKLRGETTKQRSKLCRAEADAQSREATQRLLQRYREIVHTHATLSQEDLQRCDRAVDDFEYAMLALSTDYGARIDQLADDTFQGSDIVFLGSSKHKISFYVNSINGWRWLHFDFMD